MNIHVENIIKDIQNEFSNIKFEVADSIIYNSSHFDKTVDEVRSIVKLIDEIRSANNTEINKCIKIYAEDAIMLTKRQLRDIRQDSDNIYIFLRGFILEKENMSSKVVDGNLFRKPCSDAFFESTYGEPYKDYCVGIMLPNVMSFCIECRDSKFNNSDVLLYSKDALTELFANQQERQNSTINQTKQSIIEKVEKDIRSKETTLEEITDRINTLNEDLISLFKEKSAIEKELKHMSTNKEKRIANLLNLANSATKIKGVESIEFKNGLDNVVIKTSPIHIKSMGYTFYIGRFEVNVTMSTSKVSFINLEPENRRKSHWGEGCMHPHISNTGTACLGNIAESIMIATKNADIKSICAIILNYLCSVNPDDAAGKHLTNWDVVDENGIIIDFPPNLKDCCNCGKKVTEITINDFHLCHKCSSNFCNDHIHSIDVLEGDNKLHTHVCNTCISDYSKCIKCNTYTEEPVTCVVCGKVHCKQCAEPIIYDGENVYICESCKNGIENSADGIFAGTTYKIVKCAECKEQILIEDLDALLTGEDFVCSKCLKNKCVFCGQIVHGKIIDVPGAGRICVECWKKTDVCDICEQIKLKEDLIYNNNNNTKRCKNGCTTEGDE